jgi:hypothetical protein
MSTPKNPGASSSRRRRYFCRQNEQGRCDIVQPRDWLMSRPRLIGRKAKKWRDMECTLMTRVVQRIALTSLILNLLATIYEWSATAALAGIVAILVGCAVIFINSCFKMKTVSRVTTTNHFFLPSDDYTHAVFLLSLLSFSFEKSSKRPSSQGQ